MHEIEESLYDNDPHFFNQLKKRQLHGYKLPRWTWNGENKLEKKVSKINKFYVGASHIAEAISEGKNSEWTQATLEDAIEHGKMIMERDDKDCTLVVKIVAILKRQKNPIKVTRV